MTLTQPLLPREPKHVLQLDVSILVHVQLLDHVLHDILIGSVLDDRERGLEVLDRDPALLVERNHLQRVTHPRVVLFQLRVDLGEHRPDALHERGRGRARVLSSS